MKPITKVSLSAFCVSILALASPIGALAQLNNPPVFTSIWNFPSGSYGSGPNGKLLLGANGTLYGTTYNGGNANNDGTVFELVPGIGGAYTEYVLHIFKGGAGGSHPGAGVIMDASGSLYGTAAGDSTTPGLVFKLSPPTVGSDWEWQSIHQFSAANDGSDPNCDLVMDSKGVVYGTTAKGGLYNEGTVFSITPPSSPGGTWTEQILHNFTGGSDGSKPWSGLVFDSAGALYGTAAAGGASDFGTVYKLTPPSKGVLWPLQTLYTFTGKGGVAPNGKFPMSSLVMDDQGNIFGTTYVGGGLSYGAIFELSPNGSGSYNESVIYAFDDITGANPSDALTPDGWGGFYTTTGAARAELGGSVIHLVPPSASNPSWTADILYSFTGGADGQAPLTSVILNPAGTAIYGTSFYGGTGGGTAFRIH